MTAKLLSIAFLVVFLASTATADILQGEFAFKKRPPKGAVVYFSEDTHWAPKQTIVVDQIKKNFGRHIYVAPEGATVVFNNSDSVRHNVYAKNNSQNIDINIGFIDPGASATIVMNWTPGIAAKLKCKIHASMQALIFSMASRYHNALEFKKKKKTRFEILAVPDDLSEVTIWMTDAKTPIKIHLNKGETKKITLKKRKKNRGTLTLTRMDKLGGS